MDKLLKVVPLVLSLTISAISVDKMTNIFSDNDDVEITSFGLSVANICFVLMICFITFITYKSLRTTNLHKYFAYKYQIIKNKNVSLFCNILFILTLLFSFAYNCTVIHYNRTSKPIDNDLLVLSYICLVLTAVNILFLYFSTSSRLPIIGDQSTVSPHDSGSNGNSGYSYKLQ